MAIQKPHALAIFTKEVKEFFIRDLVMSSEAFTVIAVQNLHKERREGASIARVVYEHHRANVSVSQSVSQSFDTYSVMLCCDTNAISSLTTTWAISHTSV